jgi:hypothetical protein
MAAVMATCPRPMASPSRLCRSRARWTLTHRCWITSWSFRVSRCRLLVASRLRQQANAAHAAHRDRAIGSRPGERQLFPSGRLEQLKAESRIIGPLRQGLSRAAGHQAQRALRTGPEQLIPAASPQRVRPLRVLLGPAPPRAARWSSAASRWLEFGTHRPCCIVPAPGAGLRVVIQRECRSLADQLRLVSSGSARSERRSRGLRDER